MPQAFVFGYGSLVNRATHDYDRPHPATLSGWRRTWRHVSGRSVAFLTAIPDPDARIDGLVAEVPEQSWPALDQRERSYICEPVQEVEHPLELAVDIRMYHAPDHLHQPHSAHHPILLSYLDVVVQGFLSEFGETGVDRFFQTTDGWDAPILNDRASPRYSRHQVLSADEQSLTDAALAHLGADIFTDETA